MTNHHDHHLLPGRRLVHSLRRGYLTAIFLSCCCFSWGNDPQNNDDTGALRIESETSLYSADINIKGEKASEKEKEEDKKRRSVGIGEAFSLTLTGKPKGDINELTWTFLSGRELVEEIKDTALKGTILITMTVKKDLSPEQLQSNAGIKLSVTTSEGRTVSMEDPMQVFFPNGLSAKHRESGMPTARTGEDMEGFVTASAQLIVTLQPTNVNFEAIDIIERDAGSDPDNPRQSLDDGHAGHGSDNSVPVNENNQVSDNIASTANSWQVNLGKHLMPQVWIWKCSWRVHKGSGGPGTEADDVGEIGDIVPQHMGVSKNPTSASVSKFGCSANAHMDTSGRRYHSYAGPKETEI